MLEIPRNWAMRKSETVGHSPEASRTEALYSLGCSWHPAWGTPHTRSTEQQDWAQVWAGWEHVSFLFPNKEADSLRGVSDPGAKDERIKEVTLVGDCLTENTFQSESGGCCYIK